MKTENGQNERSSNQRDYIALCIGILDKDIVQYCFKTEQKRNMNILIKANSLRKAINEKKTLKNHPKKQLKT